MDGLKRLIMFYKYNAVSLSLGFFHLWPASDADFFLICKFHLHMDSICM